MSIEYFFFVFFQVHQVFSTKSQSLRVRKKLQTKTQTLLMLIQVLVSLIHLMIVFRKNQIL